MANRPILIVEARFYEDISDHLAAGATAVLEDAGHDYERITVDGALEIPGAIRMCLDDYAAFVALGCVIRGETYHFEIVSNESAHGLMQLVLEHGIALGNGILTVENRAQAEARANPAKKNTGGSAARACLTMLALRHRTAGRP